MVGAFLSQIELSIPVCQVVECLRSGIMSGQVIVRVGRCQSVYELTFT